MTFRRLPLVIAVAAVLLAILIAAFFTQEQPLPPVLSDLLAFWNPKTHQELGNTPPIIIAVVVLLFALAVKTYIIPLLLEIPKSPPDPALGTLDILSEPEIRQVYQGKRVLVVGGTRGVGLGTALAVAKAGAHVTIVGRSLKSGQGAMERLRQEAQQQQGGGTVSFVQGDIGCVREAKSLVKRLENVAQAEQAPGFDYLVVTAAVFPDWSAPSHCQEDGVDLPFFIAVVGRYILYKNMGRFMNTESSANRVLNVCASGDMPAYFLRRQVASGQRKATSVLESIITFACGNELMLQLLNSTTIVSTHPGMLKTDLHNNQGIVLEVIESIACALGGISIEVCGVCQASILASPKLKKNQLSYVSSDMQGRLMHPKLQALASSDLPWLRDFLGNVVGG